MNRKLVLALTLVFVLIGMLGVTFEVQRVEAAGTIYIRADGSIDPPTANITSLDNVTYTFTGNINESIVIERDDIVVDGAGYTVQGTGIGTGIYFFFRSNITLKNVEVTNFNIGIYLSYSNNNIITGNNASLNNWGIWLSNSNNNILSGNNVFLNNIGLYLGNSDNNTLSGNIASNNTYGIELIGSYNDTLSGNIALNNTYGIQLIDSYNNILSGNNVSSNDNGIRIFEFSFNNIVFHNNFINNTAQAFAVTGYVNTWDNGHPSGGNYWSDYNGTDTDPDGIGDTPYVIDGNNTDNFPLMGMFSEFEATPEHNVQAISNSTITNFQFNSTAISFNVTGEDGTAGFTRILIPTALMNGTYTVYVNGTEVPYTLLPFSNGTHSYLYIPYNHSTQEIVIVPEFPTWTSILLLFTMLTVAIAITKRKLLKTPIKQ